MNINSMLNNRASLIVVALFLLVIAHSYSLFFFPPTEGWWQTYGYLYNQNLQLYSDINIAYTPLFIILNAYLLKISNLFLFHRIVGLLFVLMTFIFLFLALEKMKYSYFASIVSAFIAILLSMLNIVYIVFDYPILLNLLIVISIYFFMLSIEVQKGDISLILMTSWTAFFTILTFFTKQNVGILLILGYSTAYIYLVYIDRLPIRKVNIITYLISSILFFILFMKLTNMNWETFQLLTIQNDAKGSSLTVLFRIFEQENLKIFGKAILYFSILAVLIKYKVLSLIASKLKITEHLILLVIFMSLLTLLVSHPENAAILLSIVYLLYLGFSVYWKRHEGFLFFLLGIHVLAITMTAGLCIAGVFIIAAFAMVFVLDFFEQNIKSEYYIKLLYLVAISLFVAVSYIKMNNPYQWWGLNQSKISEAKYTLPYEDMKFLKVDKITSMFFNDVKKYADQYPTGSMYFYPHIPIFYKLYNTLPISGNLVEWFDVISTNNLKNELELLKQKEPDLIVVLDPPWSAYIGHAKLKQSDLLQPKIIEFLDQSVANGKYKLEKYQIFDNKIFGDNLGQYSDINTSLRVNNPIAIGQTCEKSLITHNVIENDFTILSIQHNGVKVSDIENYKLVSNDLIILQIKLSSLNKFIKIFGTPDITEQDFYSYRIYTKLGDSNETH